MLFYQSDTGKTRRVIFGGKCERCTCLLKKMRCLFIGSKGGKGLTHSWARNSSRKPREEEDEPVSSNRSPLRSFRLYAILL